MTSQTKSVLLRLSEPFYDVAAATPLLSEIGVVEHGLAKMSHECGVVLIQLHDAACSDAELWQVLEQCQTYTNWDSYE